MASPTVLDGPNRLISSPVLARRPRRELFIAVWGVSDVSGFDILLIEFLAIRFGTGVNCSSPSSSSWLDRVGVTRPDVSSSELSSITKVFLTVVRREGRGSDLDAITIAGRKDGEEWC